MKYLKFIFDKNAAFLIFLGSLFFCINIPLPQFAFVNAPYLVTALQICGGAFLLAGFVLISSRIFWSNVSVNKLIDEVYKGNTAAALVILGIKIFCGLAIIGFAIWLSFAFTTGVGVR